MFRFPNHTLKLKAPDQPQSAGEESLLTCVLHSKCATLCVSFSSKSKAIVFPKHIVKSKARDLSIQARKKLSCHVIVKNYLCNVSWKFWSKSKTCGGAKSKNRHPRWLYSTVVRQSEAATGGVVHENYS